MIHLIEKFKHLSGKEKIAVLAALGVATYVVYDQFAPKSARAADALPLSAPPGTGPSLPAVPSNPAAKGVAYKVITSNDPLYVRKGPGSPAYDVVGSNPPGSIIRGTSEVRTGMVEGQMGQWVAILHADGTPWGWSALKYLQQVNANV